MKNHYYSTMLVVGNCDECFNEEVQRAWDAGPPDWMSKDKQGDIGLHAGPDYLAWHTAVSNPQKCLCLDDAAVILCPKHLHELADLVARS